MKVEKDEKEGQNFGIVAVIIGVLIIEIVAGTLLLGESQDWRKGAVGDGKKKMGECSGCYRNKEVCEIRNIDERGGKCTKLPGDQTCPKDVDGNWEWRYCY